MQTAAFRIQTRVTDTISYNNSYAKPTTICVSLFVWFYGKSTFVGYLMPNPFLYILTVLFQTIQFSMSSQFKCQKEFYFKQSSLAQVDSLVLFDS